MPSCLCKRNQIWTSLNYVASNFCENKYICSVVTPSEEINNLEKNNLIKHHLLFMPIANTK